MKKVFFAIIVLLALCSTVFATTPKKKKTKLTNSKAFNKMRQQILSDGAIFMFESLRICKESKLKDKKSQKIQKIYIDAITRAIKHLQKLNKCKFKKEKALVKKKKINIKGITHYLHLLRRLTKLRIKVLKKFLLITKKTKLKDSKEIKIQKIILKRYKLFIKESTSRLKQIEKQIKKLK